jgi:hypothetical protein
MFSDKICRNNQNTHFLFFIFRKSRHLWDNMGKRSTFGHATDYIIRHMNFTPWITKATNTRSEFLIRLAVSLQQWLREYSSILCYTYIACLIYIYVGLGKIEYVYVRELCFVEGTGRLNLLQTKHNLLHIRNQSVPRCKHFSPRL